MEPGTWRGLFTAFMFLAFIGIVVWAWSKRRKKDFDEAAALPLEDDGDAAADATSNRKMPPQESKQ